MEYFFVHCIIQLNFHASIHDDDSDLTDIEMVMALEIWHYFGEPLICPYVIPAFTPASGRHQSRFHIQHFPKDFSNGVSNPDLRETPCIQKFSIVQCV